MKYLAASWCLTGLLSLTLVGCESSGKGRVVDGGLPLTDAPISIDMASANDTAVETRIAALDTTATIVDTRLPDTVPGDSRVALDSPQSMDSRPGADVPLDSPTPSVDAAIDRFDANTVRTDATVGDTLPIDLAPAKYWGDLHTGNVLLGPVDYAETVVHNTCAPSDGQLYDPIIQGLYGPYLIGLSDEVAGSGAACDQCAEVTANGKSLIAHVVTYGKQTSPDDLAVSQEVQAALNLTNSAQRGTWRLITCPTTDPIYYEYDGRQWSNTMLIRLWIRNSRVPINDVRVIISSGLYMTFKQQPDGAWLVMGADFSKGFTIQVTSADGLTFKQWLPGIGVFDYTTPTKGANNFP